MRTAASPLTRFRKDPWQPRAWLQAFRRATPRCQRQHLIDTLDVFVFLEMLAHAQFRFQTAENYVRVVYVVVARRLEAPEASSAAEREVLRHRIGRVFGLDAVEVACDVTRIRLQLERDHRRWLSQGQRQQSLVTRGRRQLHQTRGAVTMKAHVAPGVAWGTDEVRT